MRHPERSRQDFAGSFVRHSLSGKSVEVRASSSALPSSRHMVLIAIPLEGVAFVVLPGMDVAAHAWLDHFKESVPSCERIERHSVRPMPVRWRCLLVGLVAFLVGRLSNSPRAYGNMRLQSVPEHPHLVRGNSG